MRGFVVVGSSRWTKACGREGHFRFDDVPDGRYALTVWHEMGDGTRRLREFEVAGGRDVALGTVAVEARGGAGKVLAAGAARAWPEVIDRISVLLASSLEAASRPGGLKRARTLAQDAYFVEFETSGMEVAVGQILGEERRVELEGAFRDFYGPTVAAIAARQAPPSRGADRSRALLLALSKAGGDLDRRGVPDVARLDPASAAAPAAAAHGAHEPADRRGRLADLGRSFDEVRQAADRGDAEGAAARLGDAYFADFEPIERVLLAREPATGRALEARFVALRGAVGAGLRGDTLGRSLDAFRADVGAHLARLDATATGSFWGAFGASLGIILREGVEVILLLSMLFALAAKSAGEADRARAASAIRWGVGLAAAASLLTAVGLKLLVDSSQGKARELLEGLVLLAAAGVLFYVSYWLISQSESRRWMEFLKQRARQGAEVGGFLTLGLTAFLAVFREGAETALMYQAQVAIFGQGRPGMLGLLAGLGVGLVLLAAIYVAIRSASVRLPMRAFFKATGFLLFAMAVIFAGKGVFELQASGIIRVTPLDWLGQGLPELGLYPNLQAVSVQALLLAGAALALVLLAVDRAPAGARGRLGTPRA